MLLTWITLTLSLAIRPNRSSLQPSLSTKSVFSRPGLVSPCVVVHGIAFDYVFISKYPAIAWVRLGHPT